MDKFASNYLFCVKSLVLVLCFFSTSIAVAQPNIQVNGLFKNSAAVLLVNGQQRMIKIGKTSPEGIKLLSVDTQKAVVEYEGEKITLQLTRRSSGAFKAPDKAIVRIPRGGNNHFFTPGRINNRPVNFMVDTGASAIAMNAQMAQSLGLDYKGGRRVKVDTANGVADGFYVMLNNVAVGTVTVNNVRAIVLDGDSPREILLGNTYLSRVNMKVENEILVLEAKF